MVATSLPLWAQSPNVHQTTQSSVQTETTFTPALKPIASPNTASSKTVIPNNTSQSKVSVTSPSTPQWLSTTPITTKQSDALKESEGPTILQPSLERMLNTATTLQVTETTVPPIAEKDPPNASFQDKDKPIAVSSSSFPKELPKDQEHAVWYSLGQSAIKIQPYLPNFRIILLNTQDPIVRNFSAMGLLKRTEEQFTKDTHGLAAFLLENTKVNKEAITACYVVYDATFGGHIWRNFIAPFEDIQKGTDFLMAHEVAHCLDHHERIKTLASGKDFTNDEGATFGIEPHAWQRHGEGSVLSKPNYNKFATNFFKDRAQTQYSERVADAFALLWLWNQGGPEHSIDILNQTRARQSVWTSHYTAPIFVGMEPLYKQHKDSPITLEKMWSLARGQQLKVGVDETVSKGEHKGIPPQIKKEETVATVSEESSSEQKVASEDSPPPTEKTAPSSEEKPHKVNPKVTILPTLGPQVTFSDKPIDPATLKGVEIKPINPPQNSTNKP